MANPAEQLDLPALFFVSFFWVSKRKKMGKQKKEKIDNNNIAKVKRFDMVTAQERC